jgi:integrase
VLEVLTPIWQSHAETATRIRARIEHILDVAKIENMRTGDNPARWRGHLQLLLAKQGQAPEHHAALPYEALPGFLVDLRARQATAARAMEFVILSATRSGETRLALWPRMRAILDEMWLGRASDAGFIFPGDQRVEPLSGMAMAMLLRRMKLEITVHGFRSTFRDWAGDCTTHPREVVEAALAHTVGSAVERAYRRRDALEKRRKLMDAWEAYCTAPPAANVIPFPQLA